MADGTLDAIEHEFNEHGFVILQGLLPAPVLSAVRGDLAGWVDEQAAQLLAAGVIDDLFAHETFERRERAPNSLRRELHWEGMYELFFCPAVIDAVERLLGVAEIRLYPNYTVRPKFPDDAATKVLWHQDAGYTASGQHGHDAPMAACSLCRGHTVSDWPHTSGANITSRSASTRSPPRRRGPSMSSVSREM